MAKAAADTLSGRRTATTDHDLSDIELFALAEIGKEAKKHRDLLLDGTKHQIDFVVRLRGMMQVGLPQDRKHTVKPDAVELLALVLEIVPAGTRKILEKRLDSMYQLADVEARPEQVPELRTLAETWIHRWTKTAPDTQRGAVTGTIQARKYAPKC